MKTVDFLYDMVVQSKLPTGIQFFLKWLIQILESGIVVLIGQITGWAIKRTIGKFFEMSKRKYPERNYKTLSSLMNSLIKYFIYALVLFQILTIFGVSVQSILAVAGVGSIALGFGAKGLVEDFITGVFILLEDQFRVGDVVEIEGKTGSVESVGMRTTTLRSAGGDVYIFPNSAIRIVTNMSKGYNRAVVDIGVPYEAPIDWILEILKDEMQCVKENVQGVIADPQIKGVTQWSERMLNIRIVVDCKVGMNWSAENEVRRLVKVRFEKEKISAPYVQVALSEPDSTESK